MEPGIVKQRIKRQFCVLVHPDNFKKLYTSKTKPMVDKNGYLAWPAQIDSFARYPIHNERR